MCVMSRRRLALQGCRASSRRWQATASIATSREWFALVLELLSVVAEAPAAQDIIGKSSPENCPVLRGKKRARTLDKTIGAHAAEAVASKRFRSTARLGASGNIPMPRSTARSVDSQLIDDYVYNVREVSDKSCQVQISLDASVVGGEDTTFNPAWWRKLELGAWLVPQATPPSARAVVLRALASRPPARHPRHCATQRLIVAPCRLRPSWVAPRRL